MVVANIVGQQPLQMAFVHCNDVVQQIMAATLDPTLSDTILPRTFERGPNRGDIQGSHRCRDLRSILAVPIEDQESRSRLERLLGINSLAAFLESGMSTGPNLTIRVHNEGLKRS